MISEIQKENIRKELKKLQKQEDAIGKAAMSERIPSWKDALEKKVPEKVSVNLKRAFVKAFEVIFQQGTGVIEKSYNKEEMLKDYQVREFAADLKGKRKDLRRQQKSAGAKDAANMVLTTVEGAGLGLLGIGLPDIVFFTGVILKGIYEVALSYGYDYEDPAERMLILKMMELAMYKGEDWNEKNAEVNRMLFEMRPTLDYRNTMQEVALVGRKSQTEISLIEDRKALKGQLAELEKMNLQNQIQRTAEAFAMDLVVMKFIQGLPFVGIAGGLANPVYYRKVLKFVRLKYQKRYLLQKI